MELNAYQSIANQTDSQPTELTPNADPPSILVPLLGLAGEVGELLGEHKKWLRDGDSYRLYPARVREELGDILWYLSNVATKHGLKLEDIAVHNLNKTQRRWITGHQRGVGQVLLDERFPIGERLPRRMDVLITSRNNGRSSMTINGSSCGDSLRDNRYDDDGYRFHDIFHLAYASLLGWSPTLRALLRCKRKSDPRVDEVEDGGRAIVVEEGISAMVFSYAERRSFLDGVEGVNYDLLRTIKEMTAHLEVSCRSEGEWERAILTGFRVWRQVRAKGQGHLLADLERQTLDLAE